MAKRKGISIYRQGDAPGLEETDMMSAPTFNADFVRPASGNPADIVAGSTVKVLYRQPDEEGGFSLVYAWFKPHYVLPRHSHDADCLYYVVSGTAVLGNQELHAGDGFFVPSGAPYQYNAGPEGVEVLEFRHARSFDMQITESSERYAAIYANAAKHAPEWAALAAPARR
jgi:quercetin dioxygenase-like cupin family protein